MDEIQYTDEDFYALKRLTVRELDQKILVNALMTASKEEILTQTDRLIDELIDKFGIHIPRALIMSTKISRDLRCLLQQSQSSLERVRTGNLELRSYSLIPIIPSKNIPYDPLYYIYVVSWPKGECFSKDNFVTGKLMPDFRG